MVEVREKDRRTLEILLERDLTREELAHRLGVSRMTVGRYLERLEKTGILAHKLWKCGRGRPVRVYGIEPSWRYWILRMSLESCDSASVRPCGRPAREHTQPYAHGMEPWENLADCLGRMRMVAPLLRGIEAERGIAVVLPERGGDCPLPTGEIDLIGRENDSDAPQICRALNHRILARLE